MRKGRINSSFVHHIRDTTFGLLTWQSDEGPESELVILKMHRVNYPQIFPELYALDYIQETCFQYALRIYFMCYKMHPTV